MLFAEPQLGIWGTMGTLGSYRGNGMRHSEFQQWLRNLPTISLAPERDALARSKRVETFEGDLEEHFATDRMAALLARR
jgi:hypothetical protein